MPSRHWRRLSLWAIQLAWLDTVVTSLESDAVSRPFLTSRNFTNVKPSKFSDYDCATQRERACTCRIRNCFFFVICSLSQSSKLPREHQSYFPQNTEWSFGLCMPITWVCFPISVLATSTRQLHQFDNSDTLMNFQITYNKSHCKM